MSGQGRGVDSFADAPAPAVQRMVGRWPVASGLVLAGTYAAIAIHTGSAAWHFPIRSELGRLGVVVVWLALMILLPVMYWTVWVASRLRWVRGQIMAASAHDGGPDTADTIRRGARLVAWSERSHLVANWSLRIAIVMAVIGLGLVICAQG